MFSLSQKKKELFFFLLGIQTFVLSIFPRKRMMTSFGHTQYTNIIHFFFYWCGQEFISEIWVLYVYWNSIIMTIVAAWLQNTCLSVGLVINATHTKRSLTDKLLNRIPLKTCHYRTAQSVSLCALCSYNGCCLSRILFSAAYNTHNKFNTTKRPSGQIMKRPRPVESRDLERRGMQYWRNVHKSINQTFEIAV